MVQHARRQAVYEPVWQDWLWYAVLPSAGYALLAAGAACLPWNAQGPLFVIAAAALGLLLIGIHSAWDTVTYLASPQEAACGMNIMSSGSQPSTGPARRQKEKPMTASSRTRGLAPLLLAAGVLASAGVLAQQAPKPEPLVIQEQGSFAVGGTVATEPGTFDPVKPLPPAGQTYHGDHVYAFYQIPVNARRLPLVMWHGAGQFSKTWETTPDGREGFQNIFLRRRFATYVIDQPRRGNAGRSMVGTTIAPTPDEQLWFNQFRIGVWPNYFDGVQFARDPDTLNQYFRAMTPNTGPFDMTVVSDGASALFSRIGPGILVTHSQSGGPGWLTAIKNVDSRADDVDAGGVTFFDTAEAYGPFTNEELVGEALVRFATRSSLRRNSASSSKAAGKRGWTAALGTSERSLRPRSRGSRSMRSTCCISTVSTRTSRSKLRKRLRLARRSKIVPRTLKSQLL